MLFRSRFRIATFSIAPVSVPADVPKKPFEDPVVDSSIFAVAHVIEVARPWAAIGPYLLNGMVDCCGRDVCPFIWAVYGWIGRILGFQYIPCVGLEMLAPVGSDLLLFTIPSVRNDDKIT